MEKVLFVFNPRSGKEQIRSKLYDIINTFSKAGFEITLFATQAAGEAEQLVATLGIDKDLVICSGGDGTLNEVVSGLMQIEKNKRPVLGYIPAGSTNDFASSLHISRNMKRAAEHIVAGENFAIDVGRFGENRYFMYVAAFGAFTEVSYKTPQETKNLLGHQAYMLEAVKRVTSLKSYHMHLEWDERVLDEEFILGMITNTISVGGFKGLTGMDVALDDGEFEVLLVRKPRTPKDITSIVSYMLTKEGENDCVFQFKTSKLKLSSQEEVDWTLDGEFGGTVSEIEIVNIQRSVIIRRNMLKNIFA